MRLFWIFAAFVSVTPSYAGYPAATRNQQLREQLERDPDRRIPSTDLFSFAVDASGGRRTMGVQDFYHGINYWLQIRTEARPSSLVRANVRAILYGGSVSYGYALPGSAYALFGVTGYYPEPVAGGTLSLRLLDLDRQTAGRGLLIQDKELNGARILWERGLTRLSARLEGTGVFFQNDDTTIVEASFWDERLVLTGVVWTTSKGFVSVSSKMGGEGWSLEGEVGYRSHAAAALLALNGFRDEGMFRLQGRIEGRAYGGGFGDEFTGRVQQQYVSYDQLDKAYTNPLNLFVFGDSARVAAFHANFYWNPRGKWRAETLNELGSFFLDHVPDEFYYFFRHGIAFCPTTGRDDCLTAYYSNKILADNFKLPPREISRDNLPLFSRLGYFGLEASFRF